MSRSGEVHDRYGDEYRQQIEDALKGKGDFIDTVDLFYNGDAQPLFVRAVKDKLSLYKETENGIEYLMHKNRFSKSSNLKNVYHDLARFLTGKRLEWVLNLNRTLLEDRVFLIIPEDKNRGFEFVVILRNKKQDDYFRVCQADMRGMVFTPLSYAQNLIDLTEFGSVEELKKEYPQIEYYRPERFAWGFGNTKKQSHSHHKKQDQSTRK